MFPGATWDRGIDLVAVQRAKSDPGPCPDLTDEEQLYVCREMTGEGKSASAIAARLRVAERTVTRWRAADEDAL
ncbi:helix-turn-helix domain-containing protein [Streptomyces sioyaensis]|uniref:helix-turn-helix domain-containing protein n=1 Tax=Streptomyces sioyaensis TaxID=67364 RepID=UPI003D74F8CB